jgi:PKD repeat protein
LTLRRIQTSASKRSPRRRPGGFPGRRRRAVQALLACAASIALLATITASASADGPFIQANITDASGNSSVYTVSLSDLQSNSSCPLSDQSGATWSYGSGYSADIGRQAWNLGTALTCVPGSPLSQSTIQSVFVVGSNGQVEDGPNSQLQNSQQFGDLWTPSGFANTDQVPVIFSRGSNAEYDRPLRPQTGDTPWDDQVVEAAPLVVDVYEGSHLNVSISSSSTGVSAGSQTTFSASVFDPTTGQPPNSVSYSWSFGDGGTSTAPNPTYTYSTGGTYRVDLHVTDSAGGAGGITETVIVGSSTPQTTTSATKTTGPTKSSGRTPGGSAGKPTKSTGAGKPGTTKGAGHHRATHKSKPKPSVTASSGNNSGSSSSGASSSVGSRRGSGNSAASPGNSAASPGSSGASAATGTHPETSTPGHSIASTQPAKPKSPAHAKPKPKPRQPTRTAPKSVRRGKRVSGLLIGNVTPATPAQVAQLERAAAGSRATAPAESRPQGSIAYGPILAVAGVVLLLLLGAGQEFRARSRLV